MHEDGQKFFPYAHTKGVIDNNGLTVDDHLQNIYRDSSDLRDMVEGIMSLEALPDSVYGVEWDDNVSNPDCTRIGNMALHRTLPVQSRMRGCLLNDDGVVVEYLPEDNWTSSVRDGSKGQVMVEIPRHWRRFETEGTKHRVLISPIAVDGYHEVPKMYVGAYEAAVQRSTSKLCSVANWDTDYRGGDGSAAYDNNEWSSRQRPATSLSLTKFRQYARNRNQATTEWNCYTYECHKAITWLFVVEYATRNSQKAYNAQPTAEGYKQGGLGDGITNIREDQWSSFNGYRPIVSCAASDSLGNKTGNISYWLPSALGGSTVYIPRYRGIENPFGHIWKWVEGILCFPNSDGTQLDVYMYSDPSAFNDSSQTGGTKVGTIPTSLNYIKAMHDGEIMPSVLGASSSTSWCDYYYSTTGNHTRGVQFGGYALTGAGAGLVSPASHHSPSYATTDLGSRLCFIPR